MHVCFLEINGFRGIREAKVRLGEHVLLLGANNVGKSALIDGLALILGRKGLVRDLWEHDFFASSPKPEGQDPPPCHNHWIRSR